MLPIYAPVWVYMHMLYVLVSIHFLADLLTYSTSYSHPRWSQMQKEFCRTLVYSTPFLFFGLAFTFVVGGTYFVVSRWIDRINKKMTGRNGVGGFGSPAATFYLRQIVNVCTLLFAARHFFLAF